jgi:hypothetical protein
VTRVPYLLEVRKPGFNRKALNIAEAEPSKTFWALKIWGSKKEV